MADSSHDPDDDDDQPRVERALCRQVETMAGYGIPPEAIALVLEVDRETLKRDYRKELESGAIKANAQVAGSLFRKATGEGSQSVTAAIFWMKSRAGWKETAVHEVSGPGGSPLSITNLSEAEPRTQPGDKWLLGDHAVVCADASESDSYVRLLGEELAQLVFADPPYNVPIPGHVSGHGAVRHKNFQMACGELPPEQFTTLLESTLGLAARFSINGAIHFVFMDWRHQREILAAGREVYRELVNLCVWNKTNAGMGALYRSKHEFIYVFKKGTAPHINNVQLGRFGRHRSNVWDYPSQNTFNRTAKSKLSLHPTVKPVALVADAIDRLRCLEAWSRSRPAHRCHQLLERIGRRSSSSVPFGD